MTFLLEILPHKRTIEVEKGENLKSALIRHGYHFVNDCGGEGTCGSCKVLFKGESGYRLACQNTILANTTIILTQALSASLTKNISDLQVAVCVGSGYGVACDVGTSVLAFYLVSIAEGRIIAQHSVLNPQLSQGGEVISRLEKAKSPEGLNTLHLLITSAIAEGVEFLIDSAEIPKVEISQLSIAGNSAMTHFLLGKAGEGLEHAPYVSPLQKKGFLTFNPALIGLKSACECTAFPILGGFIGGDTSAGIVASGLDCIKETQALIDFGTNGEIVLAHKGKLWATSTAAGPAFEGVGMAYGMPALAGAISAISPAGKLMVIGEGEPKGFCGSGYISAIAFLLGKGIIFQNGLLREDGSGKRKWAPITDGFKPAIVQDDIRKFQLAKSAIATGLEILCQEVGVSSTEISRLYLTGSFGNHIDPVSAMRVGLIPKLPLERIEFIDNAAGRGAILFILDKNIKRRTLKVQDKIKTINLGEREDFQERFVVNLSLGFAP